MNDMMLLVEPLIPGLRRYAHALTRNHAAADDLVQDCLERIVAKWHQRRGDAEVKSWVFAILHNLAVSQKRKAARRGAHVDVEAIEEAGGVSVLPTQEDALRHRDLLAALAKLPDEQRSVVLLVSVEDLSYAQAAQVLSIPIGTVMSRLARGRDKLMVLMEGQAAATPSQPRLRRVK